MSTKTSLHITGRISILLEQLGHFCERNEGEESEI